MAVKTDNLVLDILKKIQAEQSVMRDDLSSLKRIESDVADIKTRVTRLEDIARLQRRDTAGMLVMFKTVAGDFETRIASLEQDAIDRGPPGR